MSAFFMGLAAFLAVLAAAVVAKGALPPREPDGPVIVRAGLQLLAVAAALAVAVWAARAWGGCA